MEETSPKNLDTIGMSILRNARNELFMNMPYLDLALSALRFEPGSTQSLATNGAVLYYDGAYLSDRYLRSPNWADRAYLHVILHCMLRHLSKKQGKVDELWDVACDIAVESILDHLDYPCLKVRTAFMLRNKYYSELLQDMKVLTAEGIYRFFLRNKPSDYDLALLQREFRVDDHSLWKPQNRSQQEQSQQQDRNWEHLSEKSERQFTSSQDDRMQGGEAVYEQLRVSSRSDTDYRRFLQRFAVPKEVMSVDGDAFDYIFYTYGLQLYGNMPLIEPPETKEAKRIEDFVIAIDTSMSTSGELVREFLSTTYSILKSAETFTRRMNIRILQCDDQLRSDVAIHTMEELKDYMDHFQLIGQSATDFRPVFEHVDELISQGAFSRLRGLLYFTDGMGIYPKKRPSYETAFILMDDPASQVRVPSWAIRLNLTDDDLHLASRGILRSADPNDNEL